MPLDELAGAQRLEDAPNPTQPDPAAVEPDDAEPDGVIEANGKRLVDVGVVAAERKRVRETTERKLQAEMEPLKTKAARADALEQALQAAQPYIDLIKQRPELLAPKPPTPEEQSIPDEDAANYARRYELFEPTGTPDVKRAKLIMADNRREMAKVASQAAQEAVAPVRQTAAEQASRSNFVQMAQRMDADGTPLVDPQVLAEEWATLAPELTADSRVAQVVLEKAIGKMILSGKRPQKPQRAPVYSESPGGGGNRQPSSKLTDLDRKLGFTEKELNTLTAGFNPGGVSIIGE